jgi:hypothetical protein
LSSDLLKRNNFDEGAPTSTDATDSSAMRMLGSSVFATDL